MILRVREGNLYRMRGNPMIFMTSKSRETYAKEKVAPPVMRHVAPPIAQREKVAPPMMRQVAPPVEKQEQVARQVVR